MPTTPTAPREGVLAPVGALPSPTRLPAVRYAFGGREDGNASRTVGTAAPGGPAHLLARIGATPADAVRMRQVHGHAVAVVGTDDRGTTFPDVDGLVTADVGVALVVLTADCVPVVLSAGTAVGAVHAGRRGVAAGVAPAAVEVLCGVAGVPPAQVTAVIGPAIGGCCYEVPGDLAAAVDRAVPGTRAETTWGTVALDLPGGVAAQLRAAGVGTVHATGGCTRCGAPAAGSRWFSHRASGEPGGPPAGRNAAAVWLDPARPAGPAGGGDR